VATPSAEYNLDDPDELVMWYIKVRFAEAEVEKTSKRLRRERLYAPRRGCPRPTARHFGFQSWVKAPDGKIVPGNAVPMRRVRQDQELLKEVVARILAGDSGNSSRSQHDQSPSIAGLREHRPVLDDGRRTKRGQGAMYPAQSAPIVPREDREVVVRILTDPARKHSRGRGVSYLLTGRIYCGVCGGRMYAHPDYSRLVSVENPEHRYYSCVSNVVPRMARMVHLVDHEVEKRFFYRLEQSQRFADAAPFPLQRARASSGLARPPGRQGGRRADHIVHRQA
jgi:Recombinase zinc beta ribbon domain